MSTKRKSTPVVLRKKTTREVMLDLTVKYAEAVTKLAALEQRVNKIDASHLGLEDYAKRIDSLSDFRRKHINYHQQLDGRANPAPAEERGDADTTETAEHAAQRFAREAMTYAQEIAAIRKAMRGYDDSDLVSLATTLRVSADELEKAQADAATARGECERLKGLLCKAYDAATRPSHQYSLSLEDHSAIGDALSSSPPPATGEKAARRYADTQPDEPVYVIFDGPPSHESGRFVEVETEDGRSVSVGEWTEKDGCWRLGPLYPVAAPQQPSPEKGRGEMRRTCGRCRFTWLEAPLDEDPEAKPDCKSEVKS